MARVTVSVLVPYRPDGGGHRDQAWAWVRDRWRSEFPGWELVVGRAPAGAWCKAAAVQDAAARALGDVYVVADADVWVDYVAPAVHQVVYRHARWAVPHRFVKRLTPAATERVLAGGRLRPDLDRPMYQGQIGGGITVLPRELWEQAPLDPRFTGWGQEDMAWELTLTTLAGPCWRGRSDLWHLWHPPQDRMTCMWGNPAGRELYGRYEAAAGDPAAMKQLLAEIGRREGGDRHEHLVGA